MLHNIPGDQEIPVAAWLDAEFFLDPFQEKLSFLGPGFIHSEMEVTNVKDLNHLFIISVSLFPKGGISCDALCLWLS
jgi:hypothetical protein